MSATFNAPWPISGRKGPSAPRSLLQDDVDEPEPQREEIVSIEDNAIQSAHARSTRGPRVIPMPALPPPVPYRKNISNVAAIAELGQSAIGEKFNIEKMEVSADEPKKEVVYGLILRKGETGDTKNAHRSGNNAPMAVVKQEESSTRAEDMPILLRNRNPALDHITDEEEKFKADVAGRPDEAALAAYEETPVEDFGEALMRGMGWAPGAPIGLSNAGVVLPIEYVPRHHRLGLGATPKAAEVSTKKIVKPGESREPKPMMVVPMDADGHQRHYRTLDEKLVPMKTTVVTQGAPVAIIDGPHRGIMGRVVSLQTERAVVRLANGEEVQVLPSHLAHATNVPSASAFSLSSSSSASVASSSTPSSSSSSSAATLKSAKRKADDAAQAQQQTVMSGWVRTGLIVRIVSKSYKEGRYYQKKAKVVDVPTAGECSLRLVEDERKLLEEVPERALQTVVPRTGQRVLILRGSQTGKSATLVEVNDSKEEAVVQTLDELQLRSYKYDEICAQL